MGTLAYGLAAWAGHEHVVQKNETLGGIANRYGVSVKTLQLVNGMANPNHLVVGKKLIVPDGSVKEAPHVVKAGESLGVIAVRYGVSATKLAGYNGITKPNLIRVGQKIMIPLGKFTPSPPLLSASTIKELNRTTPNGNAS